MWAVTHAQVTEHYKNSGPRKSRELFRLATLCVYSHPGQGYWGALHLIPSWTLPSATLPWDYFRLHLVITTTITKTTFSEVYEDVWVIIKTESDFENVLKYQLVLEVKVVL